MSKPNSSSSSGGIGFFGLLTVLFVALKLCGVISWLWLWVLSPLWLGGALLLAFLLVVAATAFGGLFVVNQIERRARRRYRVG